MSCLAATLLPSLATAADEAVLNPFHDPIAQVTSGLPACPVPEEPLYTRQQYLDLAHERS